MRTAMFMLLMVALLAMMGCQSNDESAEATATSETEMTGETEAQAEAADAEEATPTEGEEPEIMTKPSGVRYQDLVVGTGKEAVKLMQVQCHYTLWFADSTGLEKVERFQSSRDQGTPFVCQLGVRLIPGWSEGMIGMKEGGLRRIFVPWEQGYGERGGGPIPPKTNLIFEIEFLEAL